MKKQSIIQAVAISLSTISVLTACNVKPNDPKESFWTNGVDEVNAKFEKIEDEAFRSIVENDGYTLHETYRDVEGHGFTRPKMTLLNEEEENDFYKSVLTSLEGVKYESLSKKNQVNYDLLKEYCNFALVDLDYTGTNFGSANGIQQNYVSILSEYEFYTERDVEDYFTLIQETKEVFALCVEDEWEMIDAGFGLSDTNLDSAIEQCKHIYGEGEECSLIGLVEEKINALDLSDTKKVEYKKQSHDLLMSDYLPAYQWLETELERMKGHGTNDGGLSGYGEAGKAYYENMLRERLGYHGSIDDLFNGMSEMILAQVVELSTVAQKNLKAYYAWMDWAYYDGEMGYGLSAMTDPEEILSYFSKNLSKAFPEIVDTTYSVKYLSDAMEKVYENTLAYYALPPLDDFKEGKITVNRGICNGSQVLTTVAHEGYPGHLYQNVYYLSTNPHPIRKFTGALGYTEGWAVYAQCEALNHYKYNVYDDAVTRLYQLDILSSYILEATIDIGIHYYGWTVEETADYLDRNGFNGEVAESLYESLCEMPGVFLSYGAGAYEMLTLRAYAEDKQGKSFDLKEFHEFVLDMGCCGFDILWNYIKQYYGE